MANIVLSENLANVVKVGGKCYQLIGGTRQPVTHSMMEVQGFYDTCEECFSSSSSSSISSSCSSSSSSFSSSSSSFAWKSFGGWGDSGEMDEYDGDYFGVGDEHISSSSSSSSSSVL